MKTPAYCEMTALASQPEALENTVSYLQDHISAFVRKGERVLICFPDTPNTFGDLLARAVRRCEGIPTFWGEDIRWKTLLRVAFSSHFTTIAGHPLVILGLSKLARRTGVPLRVRNMMLAGYPSMDWMVKGIQRGLDCEIWNCYVPDGDSIVGGFSCKNGWLHLRDDVYGVEVLDDRDAPVAPGEAGEQIVYPRAEPEIRVRTGDRGRLETSVCPCGCTSPRLTDLTQGRQVDQDLIGLAKQLLYWTSILDCRLEKGSCGMEMELVVFPGEKLPKLPSAAKMVVRPWDPETDVPMALIYDWKNQRYYEESH